MSSRARTPRPTIPWLASVLLMGIGLALGGYVVWRLYPTLPARWLLFWALALFSMGAALPWLALFHHRWRPERPPSARTLFRESFLVAFFVLLWAWLQMGRLASPGLMVILAALLLLIELLLLARYGA
ncbi:MAG: hypothetical protein GXO54_02750 [Chloroflexi bacterium]|nr:hypothetical protein [Chloroflexota bacterium]